MIWEKLLSSKRLGIEDHSPSPRTGRSEYEADIDRIIFCSSFRRLARKTQVHPLVANDHVHNRLTHSIEVSRVGRALGKALGESLARDEALENFRLPSGNCSDDLAAIVQAACLAHDLGNPPFGHAGEEAIIHWFDQNAGEYTRFLHDGQVQDITKLEGNAQGFRILTQLENHLFAGGLRLTYATLATFQKYPWASTEPEKKFGTYLPELNILQRIFSSLEIPRTGTKWSRHPLAFLVEAADDICYAIIDIEDAVEIKILNFSDACDILLKMFDAEERRKLESEFAPSQMHRVNFARIRGPVFDRSIQQIIEGYVRNIEKIFDGSAGYNVFDFLDNDNHVKQTIISAKKLGRENFYNDTRKIEIEIGCYATFDTLLREFFSAAHNVATVLSEGQGNKVLWKSDRVLKLLGDHAPRGDNAPPDGWSRHQCFRRVLDFVSGMTDNYAIYVAKQLQGSGFSGAQRP
ncbi:MAG: deoxyguanosinetriphosphate triphosphohydrolase [Flavobacteriaceae bacterium]